MAVRDVRLEPIASSAQCVRVSVDADQVTTLRCEYLQKCCRVAAATERTIHVRARWVGNQPFDGLGAEDGHVVVVCDDCCAAEPDTRGWAAGEQRQEEAVRMITHRASDMVRWRPGLPLRKGCDIEVLALEDPSLEQLEGLRPCSRRAEQGIPGGWAGCARLHL